MMLDELDGFKSVDAGHNGCSGCHFNGERCMNKDANCIPKEREDRRNVIFVKDGENV